ncbi:hypothetical protein CH063_02288 [Colletotrichum higginsianum]|uniref:Uncharacterized protein n=1 Tax=Colletotrichum higginsianum (strain IMI 349063) TaxID=759273 RepID=H1VIW3_COLHI|nr:hypothetical protein CH063_02288 [Colletotrichum higginsianum]
MLNAVSIPPFNVSAAPFNASGSFSITAALKLSVALFSCLRLSKMIGLSRNLSNLGFASTMLPKAVSTQEHISAWLMD